MAPSGWEICDWPIGSRKRRSALTPRHARISFVHMRCRGSLPARRPTPCWRSCLYQSSPTTTAVGSRTNVPSTRCGLSVTPRVRKRSSMTRRVALRRRHDLDRRLPHRVLVCARPAARGDTGVEKPCAGRPAGRRGRRDRVGACRDVRGRRTDRQSGGRRQHRVRRCVAVLRLPADAIQHRRRARQRAAAGGPDRGRTRGGTTSARAGCRDAGGSPLGRHRDRGSSRALRGSS